MGSLYQSNILEAYGSTETGLARYAMMKNYETGHSKDGARPKLGYMKLAMNESGDVDLDLGSTRSLNSTKSLFARRIASKLSASRRAIPTLNAFKKVSQSVDSEFGSPDDENRGPNFDLLFESPDDYPMGYRMLKFPSSSVEDLAIDLEASRWEVDREPKYLQRTESEEQDSASKRQESRRSSSVDEVTFIGILAKHYHTSGGLAGFRRRVANDISHKYCSFCRCDEVVFLFLYVVFGIVYVCGGTLGIINCPDDRFVAYYLVADGFLSVFIFPITIVEWTKRIGGCIHEDEKLDSGVLFITIVTLRVAAAVTGTVIFVLRMERPGEDEPFCHAVHMLLEVGVVMEWGFVFLVILLPTCLYGCAYVAAKTFL